MNSDRPDGAAPVLRITDLAVRYGRIQALHGVDLEVRQGELVTLLGANGAGKSTTMRALSGLIPVAHGSIEFEGRDISAMPAHVRVKEGIVQVPEGRRIFPGMTVQENLDMGCHGRRFPSKAEYTQTLERVFELFPRLQERRKQAGGTMSGGEQQMLAIGRALMSKPRLLMLDEPSLGLAPLLVKDIFGFIKQINEELGLTVLVIEQNARRALEVADHGYIMEQGRIVLEGSAQDLRENPDVKEFYLGLGDSGNRKSFRDVKHYKRRKRWL